MVLFVVSLFEKNINCYSRCFIINILETRHRYTNGTISIAYINSWKSFFYLSFFSSFVSFTQFSPTCGRMPLLALSLWPGRQPRRPSLVDVMRGGGPSSVATRSRNPPTGRHRDSPISSSLFSHGPLLCAVG